MGATVGEILPLAASIALFPIPILTIILMLFSPGARGNVPAFIAGWIAGIVIVVTIAAFLANGAEEVDDETVEDSIDWIRLAVGAILIGLAAKSWLSRPSGSDEPEMPGWMSAVNEFTPGRAFGVGVLLSGVNPKNIALAGSAGASIGQAALSSTEQIAVGLLFTAAATLGLAMPVLYYVVAGDRARARLDDARTWLIANNATVMAVLLLLIGTVLIGDAISHLSI